MNKVVYLFPVLAKTSAATSEAAKTKFGSN
jgi:hypothetical protein